MGDDESKKAKDKLYKAVGRALSEWSEVEEALCRLYALAVINDPRHDHIGPAASGFWSTDAFHGKLRMTDAAIRSRLDEDDPLLNVWTAIHNRLGDKSKKRNHLAHGTVISWRYRDEQNQPKRDIFFLPSYYKTMNELSQSTLNVIVRPIDGPDDRPGDRLYKKDIQQRGEGFAKIKLRVKQLGGKLHRQLEHDVERRERAIAHSRALRSREIPTQSETPQSDQSSEGSTQ